MRVPHADRVRHAAATNPIAFLIMEGPVAIGVPAFREKKSASKRVLACVSNRYPNRATPLRALPMKRRGAGGRSRVSNRKGGPAGAWKWIAAGVAAAALFAAWRLLPLKEWLGAFQSWIGGMGALGGVVFGAAYIVAALLFVPGAALTVAAGVAFGLVWGTIVVSVSSTVAAALAFLIARYAARERVSKLAHRNERFAAIDRAIGENGWRVVGLLRLSPVVPFSLSNYLYGLTSVRFLPYLLASWIGMLPGTILYVSIGAAGHGSSKGGKSPLEWVLLGAGVLATAAVTLWLSRVAGKQLKKKKVGPKR